MAKKELVSFRKVEMNDFSKLIKLEKVWSYSLVDGDWECFALLAFSLKASRSFF